ncbi:MAG: hypothetical protein CL579_19120 [Alteromonadaceae bacterium]|uniref:Uncharacterized protein n=1 Tax=Paraglaciecola mesophila TaxID=197222 RepID=A0ABU9SXG8_9ALTE|nr:hypothetical protein [Alteromonadaceae bacterium]
MHRHKKNRTSLMFGFFFTHQPLSLLNLIPSVLDPSKGLFGPEYPGNFLNLVCCISADALP